MFDLYINNGENLLKPVLADNVKWNIERYGYAGKLSFELFNDEALIFEEGNPVIFKKEDDGIFYGFVFTKKRDPQKKLIKVTAYDQRRYLKNKATYAYENKKASDVLRMIAEDFRLNLGYIEDTGYVIPSRVEENRTLFDIIITALDITVENTGKMFVLDDEFGQLTLRNIEDLRLNILIDEESLETYDYETSIDKDVYNKIKLTKSNQESGTVGVYITQHLENINKWGLLQYYEGADDGINPEYQADTLLKLYNKKPHKLTVKKVIGDIRLRAGRSPIISMDLDDKKVNGYMVIDSATHVFKNNEHFIDLELIGGDFVV